MLIEVTLTLPLIGAITMPLAVAGLLVSFVFLAALFVAIHLDNKKEGN
jgi:hypothetical protein